MSVATRVIGRLHSANPSEGHRFYLYLLLLHRRGARSFEDLVTVTMPDGSSKTFFEQKMDNNVLRDDTENQITAEQLKNLVLSLQMMSTNFS